MRKLAAVLPVAVMALATVSANGATTTAALTGSVPSSENSCGWISMVLAGSDCSYTNNMTPGAAIGELQWIGPTFGGAYYTPGSAQAVPSYAPVVGDARIEMPVSGTLTVDDLGTPGDGTDDTISASLVWGAGSRNVGTGAATRMVETWDSITHTLAATPVDFATANADGGYDYVLGDKGAPAELCSATDTTDCFPSPRAPGATAATTIWTTPAPGAVSIEFTRNLTGAGVGGQPAQNRGPTTTAVIAGYLCAATAGADCTGSAISWGNTTGTQDVNDTRETPGFDNMILLVSTDADGNITSGRAYWTQEFFINLSTINPGDNSAQMGRFDFTGAVPGAVDDAADAAFETAADIDVLANDVGLVDPVTVTITVDGSNGAAVVNGSPGNAADISITYTPGAAFTGTDTFTYQVDDGTTIDTAVVTVTVAAQVDTTPEAFAFTDQTEAALSTVTTSNTVTITGITSAAPISVTGGEYSIGCTDPFTSAAATIDNDQTVCVRTTSSATASTAVDATLTVGGVSDTFTVTTSATPPDTVPDAFTFVDQPNIDRDTVIVSAPVTISGIDSPAAITVTNGEYSIGCTDTFTSAAGTIEDGQTVCVRHTSSSSSGTAVSTTLDVGGVADIFSSSTRASRGGSSSADGLMIGFLGLLALLGRRRRTA